jgi:hypothetical protein
MLHMRASDLYYFAAPVGVRRPFPSRILAYLCTMQYAMHDWVACYCPPVVIQRGSRSTFTSARSSAATTCSGGSTVQATGLPMSSSLALRMRAISEVLNLGVRSSLMMPSHSISVSAHHTHTCHAQQRQVNVVCISFT